MLLILKV